MAGDELHWADEIHWPTSSIVLLLVKLYLFEFCLAIIGTSGNLRNAKFDHIWQIQIKQFEYSNNTRSG